MKGDTKVIEYLNRGLRSELTAVSQYWLHFRMLNDWGYVELAKFWRKESIEEMNHADRFIDRILFLDGFPNLQELDPLRIGQNVQEILILISPPRTRPAASISRPRSTAIRSTTGSPSACSRIWPRTRRGTSTSSRRSWS